MLAFQHEFEGIGPRESILRGQGTDNAQQPTFAKLLLKRLIKDVIRRMLVMQTNINWSRQSVENYPNAAVHVEGENTINGGPSKGLLFGSQP